MIIGVFQFLCLPFSYFFLERGFPPEITLIVALVLSLCCLVVRLILLRSMIGLSVRIYIKNVVCRVALIGIVSAVLPVYLSCSLSNSFSSFIVVIGLTLVITLLSIYFIGCSSSERHIIKNALLNLYKKISVQ